MANSVLNSGGNSSLFRALDTHEIAGGNPSMEDGITDYLTTGVMDSVVSAGVGIYNTGAALGQVIGIAGKDAQIDEGDAINSLLGADAASFYGRHKTGIDAFGFVASSLVPGTLAIKALRMAQTAGKIGSGLEAMSGLRNADLLMNSKPLYEAAQYALRVETATPNWFSPLMVKAYGGGLRQQVMESLAFEAGNLALNNQAATLNPDDLGYFSAIGDQFWTATAFGLGGGALMGGVEALRMRGAVTAYGKAEARDTAQFATLPLSSIYRNEATPTGSKLMELGSIIQARKELSKTIDPKDWYGQKRFNFGEESVSSELNKLFATSNDAGESGVKALGDLVNLASEDKNAAATVLSLFKKIDLHTPTDLKDNLKFAEKIRGITSMHGDSAAEFMGLTSLQQSATMRAMNMLAGDNALAQVKLTPFSTAKNFASGMDENFGAAVTGANNGGNPLFNILVGRAKDSAGGGIMHIVPGFQYINEANIKRAYDATVNVNRSLGQEFTGTLDEFRQITMFHEMGHLTSNNYKLETMISNIYQGIKKQTSAEKRAAIIGSEAPVVEEAFQKKLDVLHEMIQASISNRPLHWESKLDMLIPNMAGADLKVKASYVMKELGTGKWQDGILKYLGSPAELLADGAGYITNPATRELAAKRFPKLAKMFDSEGAVAKSWEPTEAHYNIRTKEVSTSSVLGIADVDPAMKYLSSAKVPGLFSPALGRTFARDAEAFSKENLTAAMTTRADYLHYDAQWTIAAQRDADSFITKEGMLDLRSSDLPSIERIVQLANSGDAAIKKAFTEGKVRINGSVAIDANGLKDAVVSAKQDIRRLLQGSAVGYSNPLIEKILNITSKAAIGDNRASPADWLLLGQKDFTKPETLKIKYDPKTVGDYQGAVMNMVGVSVANDAVKSQQQLSAAAMLGDIQKSLTPIDPRLMDTVSTFSPRGGMVSNLNTDFGSLQEAAVYNGNQAAQGLRNVTHKVNQNYVNRSSKFNDVNAGADRLELATLDNLFRRGEYHLVQGDDGFTYAARKDIIDSSEHIESEVAGLVGAGTDTLPSAVRMGELNAEHWTQFQKANADIIAKRVEQGKATGKTIAWDPSRLYSPPRDLTAQSHVAFVVPSAFKSASDDTRFMVYAESAEQLASKVQAVKQKYGNDYGVYTAEHAKEYAEGMAYYKEGMMFDELYFDPSLLNKGRSSELLPNADLKTSATLDRHRQFEIRQAESIIRGGMELHYGEIIGQLERMDETATKLGAVGEAKRNAPVTVYRDTINKLLSKNAANGKLDAGWAKVNDWVGQQGSVVLDKAMQLLVPGKAGASITHEQLMEYNRTLADQGFKSPFDSIAEVMLSSPETVRSSTLPAAVKTMSNMLGSFMLRLDPTNSLINLVGSPILQLPVIQEAKANLQGKQLERLVGATTIHNPAAGINEPSSLKLLANANAAQFTDQGKVFMQELRDRNIIRDDLINHHETLDMSDLGANPTLQAINTKIDKWADYGSKFSQHKLSEEHTRFTIAHAVDAICEIRGIPKDQRWPIISGSVDKVHGVYSGNQRPQLFNGVVGQSVGLFQTYFFNFAQNLLKYTANGDRKQAAVLLGLQSSIFGIQSLPGFQTLNNYIGNTNREHQDLFSITNADHPDAWSVYAMYGMASHMFGTPIDFATRGSLASRNSLVIPTTFQDLPVVSSIGSAIGNVINSVTMAANGDVGAGTAFLHGLAHNSMNRPLAGIAAMVAGESSSRTGQTQIANINNVNNAWNEDKAWGAMFARAIGTKSLNETIVQNAFFRNASYKANTAKDISRIGGMIELNAAGDMATPIDKNRFAAEYESAGGEIQSFNSFWMKHMHMANDGVISKFSRDMGLTDGQMGRSRAYLEDKQSSTPPWGETSQEQIQPQQDIQGTQAPLGGQ